VQNILNLNSITTTEKYTSYLEEAYLIFSLLRYSYKSTERIKSPKKIYAVDNGLIKAKSIQTSPNNGKLLENLVFTELVKQGLKPNKEIFYYKTRNNREIDFVIKHSIQVQELIQVCYKITKENEEREIKSLLEASEELKSKELKIITYNDKEREIKRKNIRIHVEPLLKFLQVV
jgi:predicted AAA+ superfamily ATPase